MKKLVAANRSTLNKHYILLSFIMCTYMMTNAQSSYYSKQVHTGGGTEFSKPADINQDGEIDILLANGKLFWLENDGNENFTSHQVTTTFSKVSNAAMADINQDGDMDIVVTASFPGNKVAWFENDGNENFTEHIMDNLRARCLYVVDLDENGTMDVISARILSTGAYWYDNDGNGNFTKKTIDGNFQDGYSAHAADLDNDGDTDIAMSNAGRDQVVWFENDGSENFTRRTLNNSLFDYTDQVHVDDLNGDGLLDIVVTSLLNRRIVWYQNDGGGSFTSKTITSNYWSPHSVYSLDWEGDGDRDLITTSATVQDVITIWENDGTGSFTQNNIINDFSGRDVHAVDIDGDGDQDIIGGRIGGVELIIACTDNSSGPAATVLCANPTVELDENGQYTFIGTELVQGSTDPCTVFSFVSASPAFVDCEDARQTVEVTVTAQDESGNTSTCTSNVAVEDNILPEITCNDITVEVGTNIDPFDIFLAEQGTDNCPVISYNLTVSPTKVTCADIGEIPVTLTAFPNPSNGGQQVSCTVTATVVDETNPSVLCHNITVTLDENHGTATITPEDIDGVYSPAFDDFVLSYDNCGLTSLTLDQTNFDCSHIGNNMVKLTGVDESGNTKSCNATVTIVDATPPTGVICNNSTVSLDANGQYTFTGSDVFQSATDACTVSFLNASPASVSCSDVGNNVQVAVTVQDEGGNTATCTSSVTVKDNTAPSQVICNNPTVSLDANGQYTFSGSDVFQSGMDACSTVSFVSANPANVNCSDIGNSVQVIVTVQDEGGNTATCTSSVIVEDNIAPTILCAAPTVVLDPNGQYTFTGTELIQSSNDVCSGVSFVNASPSIVDCADAANTLQVTVTAQDAAGNTANCTASVTVEDNTVPELICNDITVVLDDKGDANLTEYIPDIYVGSIDNCANFLFPTSITPEFIDCSDIGEIDVTLTVADLTTNNAQSANCTVTATIVDDEIPWALCHDITVELDANGQASITPNDLDGVPIDPSDPDDLQRSFDNCDVGLSLDLSSFDCNDLGDHTVTLTATDPSGNSDDCTANVTIIEGSSLPGGWKNTDIGQSGLGNDYSYAPCSQTPEFIVTGGGNNATSVTSDNVAFSSYSICGDGSITAKIESVAPNGYGGLMIRESLDAGAKQVSVFSNMSNSLRFETRYTTNGMKQVNNFFKPSPIWLKLERQGDWVFAYYSSTGYNFQYVHGVHVPMQNCVEIGLASFTYLPGSQTEAIFSNVTITGDNGGFSENNLTSEITTTEALNIEPRTSNPKPQTLNLYPNPNNGQFILQMDEQSPQAGIITIYNPYGQQIYQQPIEAGFSQKLLDLGPVPAGMYLLEFRNETTQRIVKKFTISR